MQCRIWGSGSNGSQNLGKTGISGLNSCRLLRKTVHKPWFMHVFLCGQTLGQRDEDGLNWILRSTAPQTPTWTHMTETNAELLARLVVVRKRDGRCRYDPRAKQVLTDECLKPGVSVARVAMLEIIAG